MSPGIYQVLENGCNSASAHIFSFFTVLVSVFFVGVLAMGSYVKRKKSADIAPVALKNTAIDPLEEELENERVEKLSFMLEELQREKELLLAQNNEMGAKLAEMKTLKQSNDDLYKNSLSLSEEIRKYKEENGALTLKLAQSFSFNDNSEKKVDAEIKKEKKRSKEVKPVKIRKTAAKKSRQKLK